MTGKHKLPESDDELAVLQEAALKTDGNQRFPAAAYAFVPDPEKPSTWKLRIWETLDKKVTVRQLGRAAAAFSPGGFRGQRVQIPSGDVAAVKAKLRSEYRKLGVESSSIPASLRESDKTIPHWIEEREPMERTKLVGAIALKEDAFDEVKGELTMTIVRPGFNTGKGTYYPAEVLERDAQVFAGQKMFADHIKDKARPEGSVHNWVAQVGKEVIAESDGTLTAKATVHDPTFKEKLANLQKAGLLKEMGISIHAFGKATRTKVQGIKTRLVEQIGKCRSVDFVTFAGAGGRAEMLESVTLLESDEGDQNDVDLIDVEALVERRPDVVELIESKASKAKSKETEDSHMSDEKVAEIQAKLEEAETKLQESDTNTQALTEERDGLKGKLEESQKELKESQGKEARAVIAKAIANAEGLPKPTQDKLTQQFAEADSADGIEDAIAAETKYLADLSEAGKPTNVGESKEQDSETHKTALIESIAKSNEIGGMSPEDAKAAAEKSVNRR